MKVKGVGINKQLAVRTIAVAGSQERIGVTTQALQIVGYLNLMGIRAAYVEINSSGYIDNLLELYSDVKKDKKNGKVSYQGIELYTKEQIEHLRDSDYIFLVKDYGSCRSNDFEGLSFMEQEIKVYVCGAKPNEIYFTQEVIEKNYYRDIKFIFSYTPKSDREDILNLMEEKASVTGFADYVADPFLYIANANQTYKGLLGV